MPAQFSRRDLFAATAATGLAVCAAAGTKSVAAAGQMPKENVRYQDEPKGNQRCGDCTHFVEPNACKLVAGPIAPNGYCVLFHAKSS